MSDVHAVAAVGFDHDAATYSRGRPEYPPEAGVWLTKVLGLGAGKTAVEIGAGTGKFTTLLAQTGAGVVAVEPAGNMVKQLVAQLPDVHTVQSSAQHLPLRSGVADAVICAQSFHWFATPVSVAEFRRVMKPGGTLGLIWNVRDRSVAWVEQLSRIVDRHGGDAPRYDHAEWRGVFPARGFGPLHEASAAYLHTGSAEQVIVERTASISFVAALPEGERRYLLDEVRTLISATPELAGRSIVNMPYVTRMYWCQAGG